MKVKKFKVNKRNIKKINKKMKDDNVITILAIVAPWCGHCQSLKPEWKNMLGNVNNYDNLMLGQIEEDYLNDLDCDTNIMGYPTIRAFKGGRKIKDFNGKRDSFSITKFIKNKINKYKIKNKYSRIKKTKKRKSKKRNKSRKRKTKKKSRNGLRHKFYKMIEGKF